MSYTPTNWKAGDTVTSAKLNKIEQGITNSGIVEVIEYGLDETTGKPYIPIKTQEIAAKMQAGKILFLRAIAETAISIGIVMAFSQIDIDEYVLMGFFPMGSLIIFKGQYNDFMYYDGNNNDDNDDDNEINHNPVVD